MSFEADPPVRSPVHPSLALEFETVLMILRAVEANIGPAPSETVSADVMSGVKAVSAVLDALTARVSRPDQSPG